MPTTVRAAERREPLEQHGRQVERLDVVSSPEQRDRVSTHAGADLDRAVVGAEPRETNDLVDVTLEIARAPRKHARLRAILEVAALRLVVPCGGIRHDLAPRSFHHRAHLTARVAEARRAEWL